MSALMDAIVSHVPPPVSREQLAAPFRMRVAMIERDPYIGRIATGVYREGGGEGGDSGYAPTQTSGQCVLFIIAICYGG